MGFKVLKVLNSKNYFFFDFFKILEIFIKPYKFFILSNKYFSYKIYTMSNYFPFKKKSETNFSDACFPSLSLKERLIAFGVCVCIGIVLDILSWFSVVKIIAGKPETFAICFSLGVLVSMAGSGFLIGFKRQCRMMFKPSRFLTTFIFLCALALTLIAALILKSRLLTLVFMIIEIVAYVWYVLSYLPFGQKIVIKICGAWCKD